MARLRELARHLEVFDAAKQQALCLRNVDDELRLCLRQVSLLRDHSLDGLGLLLADVLIDVRDAAEDVCEGGEIARAIGLQCVERIDNRAHALDVVLPAHHQPSRRDLKIEAALYRVRAPGLVLCPLRGESSGRD